MKRNKYIKIFILLFSIMCNGCSTEENKEEMRQLSEYNINDLSESMKNFMNEASISSANGEHFEVKLLSIAKIKFDDEQYETSYKFYRYQILVAPKLDENIKLENITFSPSDELVDYYNDVPEGRNSLIDYQLGIENANIKEKVGKENLLAYRLDFTMSNAGDDYQTDSNISNELFDEYMYFYCSGYSFIRSRTTTGVSN